MMQPYVEKYPKFRLKEKVEIDNMKFTVNLFDVKKHPSEEYYSITIWGRKPNVTTLAFDRIVKIDDLFLKPTKVTILTEQDGIFDLRSNEEIEQLLEKIKNKKDKIITVLAEMNTKLNEYVHYSFS